MGLLLHLSSGICNPPPSLVKVNKKQARCAECLGLLLQNHDTLGQPAYPPPTTSRDTGRDPHARRLEDMTKDVFFFCLLALLILLILHTSCCCPSLTSRLCNPSAGAAALLSLLLFSSSRLSHRSPPSVATAAKIGADVRCCKIMRGCVVQHCCHKNRENYIYAFKAFLGSHVAGGSPPSRELNGPTNPLVVPTVVDGHLVEKGAERRPPTTGAPGGNTQAEKPVAGPNLSRFVQGAKQAGGHLSEPFLPPPQLLLPLLLLLMTMNLRGPRQSQ